MPHKSSTHLFFHFSVWKADNTLLSLWFAVKNMFLLVKDSNNCHFTKRPWCIFISFFCFGNRNLSIKIGPLTWQRKNQRKHNNIRRILEGSYAHPIPPTLYKMSFVISSKSIRGDCHHLETYTWLNITNSRSPRNFYLRWFSKLSYLVSWCLQ